MSNIANPFKTGEWRGQTMAHCGTDGRLHAVARFSLEQCLDALLLDGGEIVLQKVVRKRIEARVRRLERERGAATSSRGAA